MITITRTSPLTGVTRRRQLDVDPTAFARWQLKGGLIQDAFPHLSKDDREFILTGITADEWDRAFASHD